jgi:hypothetical protein
MPTMGVSKSSLRGLRYSERMGKMREATIQQAERTVTVTPANDVMRRLLKHPHAGGFPKDGSAVWPDDRFTKRRIADGDITAEAKAEQNGEKQSGEQNQAGSE